MRRMNTNAGKYSNGKSFALCRHRHFKGDCNAAPREQAKKEITAELDALSSDAI